ncbi:MAG: DUF1926 domain-containing protein [Candidatus Omnitrophota bacterium]|nr:DUF1926 domain-containing protein [Candidatus Omnitrophota bacterium]
MNEAYLALAFHLHQPIGNFESVIDRAYQNCYRPFIDLFAAYSDIKFSLHISGCLLDYLEAKQPDFLNKLKKMVACGQLELMSGGYYEPILIAIPERDVLGQIAMMSDYVRKKFDYKPQGMWIPERVWDPKLPPVINKAKIKYCILDDTHFLKAGLAKDRLYGYFLTGGGKGKVAVFPSDKKLRYSIPFAPVSEVMAYFMEIATAHENPLFTYGDDGEKFGEWPGTYKWVYEEKWLVNFLNELRKNSTWLTTVHFSDYLETYPALGEIEIPQSSYDEMLEWTGGSWLNFLTKYPESGQMHKKMLYVSEKLSATRVKTKSDINKLNQAKCLLYKGQCNCAYWHGVFGGLYLYHLRSAIYANLIQADKKADELLHKKDNLWQEVKIIDFDYDGKKEIVVENADFSLYFDPQDGGVLKELDFRPNNINLVNTLARRKETYHEKIKEAMNKSTGCGKPLPATIHGDIRAVDSLISQKLIYDRFGRYCLREYFISPETKRTSFMDNSFEELGDFSGATYQVKKENTGIALYSRGHIGGSAAVLSKRIGLKSATIAVDYSIENKAAKTPDVLFAVEFNLTLPFLNDKRYRYFALSCGSKRGASILGDLDKDGALSNVSSFGIKDKEEGLGICFEFPDAASEVWYFPVSTVSQSERAYELNFQCACVVLLWRLNFTKSKHYNRKINIALGTPPRWPKD